MLCVQTMLDPRTGSSICYRITLRRHSTKIFDLFEKVAGVTLTELVVNAALLIVVLAVVKTIFDAVRKPRH